MTEEEHIKPIVWYMLFEAADKFWAVVPGFKIVDYAWCVGSVRDGYEEALEKLRGLIVRRCSSIDGGVVEASEEEIERARRIIKYGVELVEDSAIAVPVS